MQINSLPSEFKTARPILQTIEGAGFEAYFVGGSVRDTILKDPIHDVDIATSAYPSEVKALFHKTVDTGIKHGTVMILDHHHKYEVTTFRTESGYQDFRRPDKVTFVRSLSEDLKRRDFTVNALALKEDGTVVDLFSGLNDLAQHVLRAVGSPEERFHEDALRMMRAVRFASKLDFTIEKQTEAAIQHHAKLLQKIAVERIRVEFEKMMMGQNPLKGVRYFLETGLYAYCPRLNGQKKALSRMLGLNASLQLANETQVWLFVCRILGLSAQACPTFLKAWKTSNDLNQAVKAGLTFLEALDNQTVNAHLLFQTGERYLKEALTVQKIFDVSFDPDQYLVAYKKLPIKSSKELAINGRDLITTHLVTPGPDLGRVLTALQEGVLNGTYQNQSSELISAAKTMLTNKEESD